MFTFRTWLCITTRHWMGGVLQYILVFTWEVGFKSNETWVKTGLVIQLSCLPSNVLTVLHSAVTREILSSRYTTATQSPPEVSLWWADCHSQVLCVSGTLVLHSWGSAGQLPQPPVSQISKTLCVHDTTDPALGITEEMCNKETEWERDSPPKMVEGIQQKE